MHFSRVTLREGKLWKTHVFSFKGLMWQIFKHILFSFTLPSSCLLQPQTIFHSKTQNSRENFFKSYLRYVYTIFFLYFLRLCRKFLGFFFFLNWIILKKGWELYFLWIFFNFLFGLCPIWVVCVCGGPLWHFNMFSGKIQSCSCIAHMLFL